MTYDPVAQIHIVGPRGCRSTRMNSEKWMMQPAGIEYRRLLQSHATSSVTPASASTDASYAKRGYPCLQDSCGYSSKNRCRTSFCSNRSCPGCSLPNRKM